MGTQGAVGDRHRREERFVALPVARPGFEAIAARSRRVFDRHTHDAFAFGYIEEGGQGWHSGRGQVEGRAGDLIMSNPGEVHDGRPLGDGTRTWRMLHVDPAVVRAAGAEVGLARPEHYEFASPVVGDLRLARIMRRLFHALEDERSSPLRLDELFLCPPPERAAVSRIGAARTRIDDDPAGGHGLAELANDCGLTPWQLLRAFAKETGFTPHAYQVQRRIELARGLISGGASLAQASALSGFADQSHMTRTFRRKYGFSPGAWARSRTRLATNPVADAIAF